MIKQNRPFSPEALLLSALLLLGFLEFTIAAIFILRFAPDPKNTLAFGYSLPRLVFFLLALVPALWLLALLGQTAYRGWFMQKLESMLQKRRLFWGLMVFALALLALVVLTIPFEMLGKYGLYFERARPLLFVLCIYPAQFSLNWLIKRDWRPDWVVLRPVLISLGALLALCGFIIFSGLGITPEQEHWNVAGNPITTLQVIIILLTGVLVFGLLGLIRSRISTQAVGYLDLLIACVLFAGAVLLWSETPIPHNEFSTRPAAPYFQIFPASDARVHDLGALAVLNGAGILFRTYTDKPLYMVFLATLHIFADNNYNLISFLHTCFMALMVPILYILGKSFHSRLFGFILAGIILVRQQNAILLSNVLNFNATPAQFLTEVPTLLGIIVSTCALFYWMRKSEKGAWRAFVAGGILGAVSLVRLNPFLLIPAMPVFLFLSLRHSKKEWFLQSMSFILGCAILIMPWVFTGANQSGQSFFILKFYDIIHVRYGPSGVLPFERNPAFVSETRAISSGQLQSAGLSFPPIDIHTFPGFVINHTLHNFVGSFLTLPDSLQPIDQNLDALMERPIWSQGQERVAPQQIPFMILNLGFLAIGLAWSWKRWKWAGFSPLFVFVIYSLSLGLGRTSGSRYLVPMDWVVDFYFALGLLCLLQLLPQSLRFALEAEPEDEFASHPAEQKPKWMIIGAILLIFCVAAFVPVAQKLIPPQEALCQSVNQNELTTILPLNDALQSDRLVYGEVLYPEINKDSFSFSLLTCQQVLSFEITGFHEKLDIGQLVIVGLLNEYSYPRLEWIALPSTPASSAKILWQSESK